MKQQEQGLRLWGVCTVGGGQGNGKRLFPSPAAVSVGELCCLFSIEVESDAQPRRRTDALREEANRSPRYSALCARIGGHEDHRSDYTPRAHRVQQREVCLSLLAYTATHSLSAFCRVSASLIYTNNTVSYQVTTNPRLQTRTHTLRKARSGMQGSEQRRAHPGPLPSWAMMVAAEGQLNL